MTMELDEDLGEGPSKIITSSDGYHISLSLRELESRAVEWPGAVKALVNTAFEDGDLEEAYSMVIQNTGDTHRPDADTVLQLIALALEPDACLRQPKKQNGNDDLLDDVYALRSYHASQKAIPLLRRWLRQPGPSRILASLPRRADVACAPARARYSFLDDDEDQLKPLQVMARRVALSNDIWQVLQGGLKDQDAPRSFSINELANKLGSQLSDPSWNLLKFLVEAWRVESEYRLDNQNANLKYSPSLLTQFKPSAIGGPAEDVTNCMDIIFQPFKDTHLSNFQRTQHVETALGLLSLLADLSSAGMIEKVAFQSTVCDAMYQLRLANLQEFVILCFPDKHGTKIELLNFYLTKFSVSASTTFPPPLSKHAITASLSAPSTSPPKPNSSAAPNSSIDVAPSKAANTTASERIIIEIDSDTSSSDSDVVCLTPINKNATPKAKNSPVKARPSAASSPIKARPAAQASLAKQGFFASPQSLQDVKPTLPTPLDPLLPLPSTVITKMSKQIPREFSSLATDAPKMRIPKRMADSSKRSSDGRTVTQGIKNAEKKFSTIKLELARVYIAHAINQGETALVDSWRRYRMSAFLSEAVRSRRYMLESEDGELPADLQTWEEREQAVVDAIM